MPTTPLREAPGDVGAAVVPAASIMDADVLVESVSASANRPLREWLAEAREAGIALAAACTGTFLLAESGIFDGVTATTSWWLGPAMRRRYPRVDVDESRTLCRADKITTAGATLMHLDLALSLIASRSPALAETVSRYLVVGDGRTQIASAIPEVMARGDSVVAAMERWVRAHLAESFGLADAAAAIGVTVRSLQRATQAEIGVSPRDFVDAIRLERATPTAADHHADRRLRGQQGRLPQRWHPALAVPATPRPQHRRGARRCSGVAPLDDQSNSHPQERLLRTSAGGAGGRREPITLRATPHQMWPIIRDGVEFRSGLVDLVVCVRHNLCGGHRLALAGERFVRLVTERIPQMGNCGTQFVDRERGHRTKCETGNGRCGLVASTSVEKDCEVRQGYTDDRDVARVVVVADRQSGAIKGSDRVPLLASSWPRVIARIDSLARIPLSCAIRRPRRRAASAPTGSASRQA